MASDPANSRRGRILNNLIRQLKTITVANGFSREIFDATMDVKTWAQTPEANTPMVYVIDGESHYQYHPGRLVEVTWNVDLYGVMKNQTQSDMEEFISDIDKCLTDNVTLGFEDTGRVCAQIRLKSVITDNQLFSEIEGSQLFKASIDIIYTKCFGER